MSQNRTEINGLLARHGVTPLRRWGQHFLADRNLIRKIVSLLDFPPGFPVLEIGAGTGTLTRELAEAGFAVTAVEIDIRLRPVIEEALEGREAEVRLLFEDAARWEGPGPMTAPRWGLAANLPYGAGTPILLGMLRTAPGLAGGAVMLQQEVAERLTAAPGSGKYGFPSVVMALYGEARMEFRAPPQVFVPPPNVWSAVVSFTRTAPPEPVRSRAARLASAGFAQRRKMLRASLRAELGDRTESLLERAGIDPRARAEELSADRFLALAGEVGA